MPTAEEAQQEIIKQIEENRLEAAVSGLLSFAEQYSPDKITAVRMRRSDLKTLEEEALMIGETSGIRERRSTLKLQLFRLADAIRGDVTKAESGPSGKDSNDRTQVAAPAYTTDRGEGPVNLFLAYAPGQADQAGSEELKKSLALLLHLKRIEIFDQQTSPSSGDRGRLLRNALNESEVILLLLSNNFLANPECLTLQQDAYRLYEQNRSAVVPVLFTPCEWKELDIGRLQALPRNGLFITKWENADEAYTKISREINKLAGNVRGRLDYEAPPLEEGITSEAQAGNQPKQNYNTSELRKMFREGNTGALIQRIISMTIEDGPIHDQALLLEQRWKEVSEEERNNTASQESITIRMNKLNQDMLQLIRDMEK